MALSDSHSHSGLSGDGSKIDAKNLKGLGSALASELPGTTKGDVIVHNGTENVRLAVGTDGYFLKSDSGATEGVSWAVANPLTTKGDVMSHDGTNAGRLAVGLPGQVITPDPDETLGVKWVDTLTLNSGGTDYEGGVTGSDAWVAGTAIGTTTYGMGLAGYGHNSAVRFGGYTTVAVTTCEEYDGTTWASSGAISVARYYIGSAGIQQSALAFGGNDGAKSTLTEEYNGSTWSTGGALSTAVELHTGAGVQNAAISVAGRTAADATAEETEEYDGTSWSAGGSITTGVTLPQAAGLLSAGMLTGGLTSPRQDTYHTYDGTSWTSSVSMGSEKDAGGMAGQQDSAICFGGRDNSGDTTDSEAWNGTAWSAAASMITAAGFRGNRGYAKGYAIAVGGFIGATSSRTALVEEYDGTTVVSPPVIPTDSALTTKGDLLVHNGSNLTRLAVGSDGDLLEADSADANGVKWNSTLTTKGDIMVYGSARTRLPVGTNGQFLLADSSDAEGLVWSSVMTGAFGYKVKSITNSDSPYTAASETVILCNCTSGAITVNLPAASGVTGRLYEIKKTDSSGNAVTIDGDGSETIDGSATKTLSSQYDSLSIVCDGSNWNII